MLARAAVATRSAVAPLGLSVGRAAGRAAASAAVAHGPEARAPMPCAVACARLPALEANLSGVLQLQLSLPHNIWSEHSLHGVQLACMRPGSVADSAAYGATRFLTCSVDLVSWLTLSRERRWLRRLLFLSTISGAPGRALAAAERHPSDKWARALLSEAASERARLAILMEIRAPGPVSQTFIESGQALLSRCFSATRYALPRFCKWFGGYVEEEQVKAYTQLLEDIEAGAAPTFANAQASALACEHYGLPVGTSLREVISCMRAERMLSR